VGLDGKRFLGERRVWEAGIWMQWRGLDFRHNKKAAVINCSAEPTNHAPNQTRAWFLGQEQQLMLLHGLECGRNSGWWRSYGSGEAGRRVVVKHCGTSADST